MRLTTPHRPFDLVSAEPFAKVGAGPWREPKPLPPVPSVHEPWRDDVHMMFPRVSGQGKRLDKDKLHAGRSAARYASRIAEGRAEARELAM